MNKRSGKPVKFVAIAFIIATALIMGWMIVKKRSENHWRPDHSMKMKNEPSAFGTADKVVGKVLKGHFVFTDQDKQPFDLTKWLDKPLIVSLIFTDCPHVCPTITSSLANYVQESKKMKLGKDYRIVTVGFDPVNDTPKAMREFGTEFIDTFDNWRFVTGDPEKIRELGDKLGMIFKPGQEGGWDHTIAVTILSPGGMVFKQVFGMDYPVSQLDDAIKLAATGINPKSLESFYGR